MARADYDVERVVEVLKPFGARQPHLKLILEPGSAFAWQTGCLESTVMDVVEHPVQNGNGRCAVYLLMSDCLEMPYHLIVRGAHVASEHRRGAHSYRADGNSCLGGDLVGNWKFDHPLEIGERLIFET